MEETCSGFYLCLCGYRIQYKDLFCYGQFEGFLHLEFHCCNCGGISTVMNKKAVQLQLKWNK